MKWLKLKLVLLSLLFVLLSGVSVLSQEYISVLKLDFQLLSENQLKSDLLIQNLKKQINKLQTNLNQQIVELTDLKVQLETVRQFSMDQTQQLTILRELTTNQEKYLISINKKAELQRILLIVIPIALTVLLLVGIGGGIVIGWRLKDVF